MLDKFSSSEIVSKISQLKGIVYPVLVCDDSVRSDFELHSSNMKSFNFNERLLNALSFCFKSPHLNVDGMSCAQFKDLAREFGCSKDWFGKTFRGAFKNGLITRYEFKVKDKAVPNIIYVFSKYDLDRYLNQYHEERNKSQQLQGNSSPGFLSMPTELSGISITPTDEYIRDRDSSIIEMVMLLADILPESSRAGSYHESVAKYCGKDVEFSVYCPEGSNIANITDIRTLMILVNYAENAYIHAIETQTKAAFSIKPFEVGMNYVLQSFYGEEKTGGGYNNRIMASLRRLEQTTIEPKSNLTFFNSFIDEDSFRKNSEQAKPFMRKVRLLDLFDLVNDETTKWSRIQFKLGSYLSTIIYERVKSYILSGKSTPNDFMAYNTIHRFANNGVLHQSDKYLLFFQIKIYGYLISKENNYVSWDDFFHSKLRSLKSSETKYKNAIEKEKLAIKSSLKKFNAEVKSISGNKFHIGDLVVTLLSHGVQFEQTRKRGSDIDPYMDSHVTVAYEKDHLTGTDDIRIQTVMDYMEGASLDIEPIMESNSRLADSKKDEEV